ncbi:transposase [Rhodococcus sp. AQ5-07]|uniref:transposase n=1 Tax=Rhodococcus sp. AQ5-07 TaxID=2054902 RepID=UPI001E4089E5|nr:transposase [Rhodococcus sp. AQ5-07]
MSSPPVASCPACPLGAPGHRNAVYPSSSLTDAQWAVLRPLLPRPGNSTGWGGRPEKYCRRAALDAILYVVRGGIAWRQLPVEFPPASTVYGIFVRWVRAGAWQRIHDACATGSACGPDETGARPRRSSTRRPCPQPTLCPAPVADGTAVSERMGSSGT